MASIRKKLSESRMFSDSVCRRLNRSVSISIRTFSLVLRSESEFRADIVRAGKTSTPNVKMPSGPEATTV